MANFSLIPLFSSVAAKTQKSDDPYEESLHLLLAALIELLAKIEANAQERLKPYRKPDSGHAFSASTLNLAHYLAFRQIDLRALQERLAEAGLSSLGRAEASVYSSISAIIVLLSRAVGKGKGIFPIDQPDSGLKGGKELLKKHADDLFGTQNHPGRAHIMVTLDTEAAWNYPFIKDLLRTGMTCARINCAHDDAGVWLKMIENIRKAETETGKLCKILMDLAGHKIRTGPIVLEQPVHHIKVKKDRTGKVVASGYLVLTADPDHDGIETDLFKIKISKDLHKKLTPGLYLSFTDYQEKQRYLKVEKALSANDWLVSCDKPAYLVSGCRVRLVDSELNPISRRDDYYFLGKFDGKPLEIRLFKDELLLLTFGAVAGRPAEYSDSGALVRPAHIGCTLASAIKLLQAGQPVWIDDGKLGAVVEKITEQGVLLRVTAAKSGGVKIQSDKGINFPNTDLQLPALSKKDLKDLDFVCSHADLVGFSFVETLADVKRLKTELNKRNAGDLPIIIKVETNRAVKNLPDILLGAMEQHRLGVMIARGDLAVELGSDRLAEIQEEILWLCEAAHIPVIWATQVLESIAKKGVRSRPEFTDAAMAARAECVMLNKGPHILEAIEALINVMKRMEDHQHKKFSRLRALHW